jgi:hypothetical protein
MGSRLGSECSRRKHHQRMGIHQDPWWLPTNGTGPSHQLDLLSNWRVGLFQGRSVLSEFFW